MPHNGAHLFHSVWSWHISGHLSETQVTPNTCALAGNRFGTTALDNEPVVWIISSLKEYEDWLGRCWGTLSAGLWSWTSCFTSLSFSPRFCRRRAWALKVISKRPHRGENCELFNASGHGVESLHGPPRIPDETQPCAEWPPRLQQACGRTYRMAWKEGHLVTFPLASAFSPSFSSPSAKPYPQHHKMVKTEVIHYQKVL